MFIPNPHLCIIRPRNENILFEGKVEDIIMADKIMVDKMTALITGSYGGLGTCFVDIHEEKAVT